MTQEPEMHRTNIFRDEAIHRAARRAFLTGSLASVPVITTLASRPAWAGCGLVSVLDSISHDSHVGATNCEGMTAAEWLSSGVDPSTLNMPFDSVFTSYLGGSSLTIGGALAGSDALLRESAAAWLNANQFPGTFGYSPLQVTTHFENTDPALLLSAFQAMNNASSSA
jgi:hypothetical protein